MEHLQKQCKGAFRFKTEQTYTEAQVTCKFQIITFESLRDEILKAF